MKRYLITGASRGIGRAIAEKLAGKDVELLLHGRDTVALAQTRKVVEPQCTKVTPLIHDLATARGVSDVAWFERRQHSFRRGKNRILKLERLLYEQICARRLLAVRARRAARPQSARDQCLSRRN